ncbi:hypothetical protein GCM10023321_55740 [Pseudonocardia eucalypti]|uniref:Pyruvate,water dikinase n=1 Tax=Pseudonocardia eucalypti TaxID=648755 RepID=A0ABP9QQ95_9PSEU|nr:pyruvate,water dikinase [Pseudonocardia eucalypti]
MTITTPSDQALPLVRPLADPAADLAQVGGKGASLARLATAGLPVPTGFHVTTEAYRRFLAEAGLERPVLAAVAAVDPARPETLDAASTTIAALFAEHPIPADTAAAITARYRELGADAPVAVRSSATAEDLPELSFAGQQDTYLNIRGEAALLRAVRRCWASLWTARAIGYRARTGIAPDQVGLAVVVQELVAADAAGILFTANPMTGARDQIVINASWGLGEAVVGGQVTPDTVVVDRATGEPAEQRVADKTTMTVRTETGTAEVPVPEELRREPVLNRAETATLTELGERIEKLYGTPMDVEWTRRGGEFFVVQARPITTLRTPPVKLPDHDSTDGGYLVWNDSLAGDYLWTSTNIGEAVPDVVTPCGWSALKIFLDGSLPIDGAAGHKLVGNIGGRLYLNLSTIFGLADAFFMGEKARTGTEQVFGILPEGMTIPELPTSRWRIMGTGLTQAIRARRKFAADQKVFADVVPRTPARCAELRGRIRAARSTAELARLWREELEPLHRGAAEMLGAGARSDDSALALGRKELRKLVSEEDANLLLSGAQADGGTLDSLGPVVGLAKVARGELTREAYLEQWGHRGPHELEISFPRPAEDPHWLDAQLAGLADARQDAVALLERQDAARRSAWRRLTEADADQAERLRGKLATWTGAARMREQARSEAVRVFWVVRDWVLRAGELTGHGEDLFFLYLDELLGLLDGPDLDGSDDLDGSGDEALAQVAPRRATHHRYAALPPYPSYIRGAFDPFAWYADPNRRGDAWPSAAPAEPAGDTITGYSGAAGVVEGTARVLASADEGASLRPGEILVTTITNVGWTPLFPRAAAVVTDVGAPLSHAAIVARELGIPAVVGCGDATMRLRTGDRVRVDGSRGTVQVI